MVTGPDPRNKVSEGVRIISHSDSDLYKALGGHPGVVRAVDRFYERILDDPTMSGYFAGVDMEGLRRHQVKFLSAAVGGPQVYGGRDLATAHAGLQITDQHFNRMLGHLNAALVEVGADDGTIRSVVRTVSALQDQIVEQ